MALASISSFGATVSFLIYFSLPCSNAAGENIHNQFPSGAGSRRPMVFPLFLSRSNASSPRSVSIHHRKLHKADSKSQPHSRMRLYDDLLLNGYALSNHLRWISSFFQILRSGSCRNALGE